MWRVWKLFLDASVNRFYEIIASDWHVDVKCMSWLDCIWQSSSKLVNLAYSSTHARHTEIRAEPIKLAKWCSELERKMLGNWIRIEIKNKILQMQCCTQFTIQFYTFFSALNIVSQHLAINPSDMIVSPMRLKVASATCSSIIQHITRSLAL